ncbi:MAG: small ribosomal subunit Rsm22 family protein [Chthoniobacterales bacterium]
MKPELTTNDWQRLRDLRQRFLNDASEDYWKSIRDLELYDQVYAQRIGWKWRAVLESLTQAGWQPHSKNIIDWGCGTAIASRCVTSWSGIQKISLLDQSKLALAFAQKKLSEEKISATFFKKERDFEPSTLLLISHVVGELNEKELLELTLKATTADEVIWVEPGSHKLSRLLSSLREVFIAAGHQMIAPCVHQQPCPLLDSKDRLHFKLAATDSVRETDGAEELNGLHACDTPSSGATKSCAAEDEFQKKSRHWCHFFAKPPIEIFQSAFWHEVSRKLGIDLRSLPYSYFACSRFWKPEWSSGAERLIGNPRAFKGHCKLFCCGASGIQERTLQKRDHAALFKEIVKKERRGVFLLEEK